MIEPGSPFEREQLSLQLARLYGFDLSILEGMTIPQLRHLAQVSASRLAKFPQKDMPGPGEEVEDEQLEDDVMPDEQKVQKATAYFDRHCEPLTRLGFTRRSFAEGYRGARAKYVRRLR